MDYRFFTVISLQKHRYLQIDLKKLYFHFTQKIFLFRKQRHKNLKIGDCDLFFYIQNSNIHILKLFLIRFFLYAISYLIVTLYV